MEQTTAPTISEQEDLMEFLTWESNNPEDVVLVGVKSGYFRESRYDLSREVAGRLTTKQVSSVLHNANSKLHYTVVMPFIDAKGVVHKP